MERDTLFDKMKIDKELLDKLSKEASLSPRLRLNLDMRNSSEDNSQRMLNAIEPGTELPIHRHRNSSESCIVLRGSAVEIFYDDTGNIIEHVMMKACSDYVGVNIEKGCWHKIVSLEPGTIIFEAKDGAYEPISQNDTLTLY